MRLLIKSMTAIIALGGLALGTGQAVAGCGAPELARTKPMIDRHGRGGQFVRATFFGPFFATQITGLWKFTFSAHGNVGPGAPPNALPLPDGTPVDAGFVTWHDDGTELMNSGRTPASGSFCMGVWRQTGPRTFKLNHWALSWIPDYKPGVTGSWSEIGGGIDEVFRALGPANIEEVVTLKGENSYVGWFKITQYVNDGTQGPINDVSHAPVAYVILGNINAERVTVN